MSGIYGIFRHDGAPVDPIWMERMRAAMAYYGPDGGGGVIEGSIGLGYLLLKINPEDEFEQQPMDGNSSLLVTSARLDNRKELLEAFSLTGHGAAEISDGRLVSLAYERWGEQVCTHLQGDWALAGWDRRERKLLLARDACGNATLYYYEGKGFLAFATSIKALLAIPGVKIEPDRLRLAEVLVSWQHDAELTAYKGFRRLLWAHAMAVNAEGRSRMWRHWSPEGRALLSYRRDEEYEEAFLEQYTRAVRSCLRSQKPIAATLSGGRDSGSVAALAAPLLAQQGRCLTAYTSVPCFAPDGAGGHKQGNEWGLAHATALMAGDNVEHLPVDAQNYRVLQGIEHLLDVHDGPGHAAGNQYWLQAVTEAAAKNGSAVVLTGQMGNAAVSWSGNGSALLALLQGRRKTALSLLLHAEPNPWLTIKRQILKPLLTPGIRAFRRLRSLRGTPWQSYSALNARMGLDLHLQARMRAAAFDPTYTFSPLEDMQLPFFKPNWGIGCGISSELGARHSLSFLDPTFNRSLVEFILQVPDDQFRRNGQASRLFRKAFASRLPQPVLDGRIKGLQAADVGHRVLRERMEIEDCLNSLACLPEVTEILDLQRMRGCLADLAKSVNPETTQRAGTILLRGLGVGIFLRHLADTRS